MGIYSAKFEAAVDSIQTPDEVGVDLDQVEKDIMGDDGIEAHRDEVEAAEEGLIGDPVEESAFIMYEAEYNYNQIMRAIGVAELREAASGREMIYEAADIKGFFEKVKKLLTTMFERITETVKTVLAKMDFQVKIDKKFVSKYEKEIKEGAAKDTWHAKGFKFPAKIELDKSGFEEGGKKYQTKCEKALADLRDGKDVKDYLSEVSGGDYRATVIKNVAKVDASDIEGLTKALIAKLFGDKYEDLNGVIKIEDVINTLKNDRETAGIRDVYNSVKRSYQASLKAIAKLDKEIDANKYQGVMTTAMTICEAAARITKFEKNVVNATYSVYMKAARAKRAQARAIAHACARAGKKADKAAAAPKHESAISSAFSNINFI